MKDHPTGCSCCQAPLDPLDSDIRSEFPDPVLRLPERDRTALWGGRNLLRQRGMGPRRRAEPHRARAADHDPGTVRRRLVGAADGKVQHEWYGLAAVPGSVGSVICMFDEEADLDWAREVWRSLRHHP